MVSRITTKGSAALLVGTLFLMSSTLLGCPTPPPAGEGEGEGEQPTASVATSKTGGIVLAVENIAIPTDLTPEVTFTIKDSKGGKVDLSEITDLRFTMAYLKDGVAGGTNRFISYTVDVETAAPSAKQATANQSTYDHNRFPANDSVTDNGDNTYVYKFSTVLPTNYNKSASHQLGVQIARDSIYGSDASNTVKAFVPNGGAGTGTREIVTTATCNECHDVLSLHGRRTEIQYCILCHNDETADAESGNSVDFPELIHKIHMGEELQSVQDGGSYYIQGFREAIHDYSEVAFPQSVTNCTVCHDGSAPDADFYATMPTMAGCGSCHETWFGDATATPAGMTNHTAGPQVNESSCVACHGPGANWDPADVHMPLESDAAPGLVLTVNDVSTAAVTKQGDVQVTMNFNASDKNGPVTDLSVLSSVGAVMAWPATEYEDYASESVRTASVATDANGNYDYTFTQTLPANLADVVSIAMTGRRNFTVRFSGTDRSVTQGTTTNGQVFFTIDGTEVDSPRREVIDEANCFKCHNQLMFHGTQRTGVELCMMCHNPNETDANRTPVDPVTVNFKDMLHKIHMGSNLTGDYTVYGFGNTPHDFTGTLVPRDVNDCTMCHIEGTYKLPLGDEVIGTTANGVTVLPEAAACASCHDSAIVSFHAAVNTAPGGGESCAVCHSGSAIDAVHGIN